MARSRWPVLLCALVTSLVAQAVCGPGALSDTSGVDGVGAGIAGGATAWAGPRALRPPPATSQAEPGTSAGPAAEPASLERFLRESLPRLGDLLLLLDRRMSEVAIEPAPVKRAPPSRLTPVRATEIRLPPTEASSEQAPAGPTLASVAPVPALPPAEAPSRLAPVPPAMATRANIAAPAEPGLASAAPVLSPPPPPPRPVQVAAALAPALEAPPDPARGFRVQIGSFRSREDAAKGWGVARDRAPDLLDAVAHLIAEVDLGANKGIFHRVQAGAFPTKDGAEALCNALKARRMDCLVVAP